MTIVQLKIAIIGSENSSVGVTTHPWCPTVLPFWHQQSIQFRQQPDTLIRFAMVQIINIVTIELTWDLGPDNGTSCRDYFNILDHKLAIDTIEPIDIIDVQTNDAGDNNRPDTC